MASWSDSRERSDQYRGNELAVAIMKFFEDQLEEELLKLRWDNESMRADLARMAMLTMAKSAKA